MRQQMMEQVTVYSVGLCYASACAPAEIAPADLVAAVNREHPTGLESQWALSADKTFASGAPNPSPCEKDAHRVHVLLEC